jgi:glycosyltransferase involved in cell wall biosynthesis
LRLAFVIPWYDEKPWLWEFLPAGVTGEILSAGAGPKDAGPGRSLPPYLREATLLAGRKPDWGRYDVVFAWELRSVLATALLLRAAGGRRKPRFVAVGPILKGPVLKALPLVRGLLADAEKIVCFSSVECEENSRLLGLPRERFVFFPTPWRGDETETDRDDGTILALGQSNRDYGTLIRAVRGTGLPVTIVAGNPSALGGEEPPANVTVRYNTDSETTTDLIAGATLHCVPLHPAGYSAGQTVLLRAMARGKAVVVSDIAGVRDYVRDGETAVVVPPGDEEALRGALVSLWNDPARRREIGRAAARAVREEFGFPRFTARLLELVGAPERTGKESEVC